MSRIRRIQARFTEHQTFLLLLIAFTGFRFLAAVALRPGGFIANYGPDQPFYLDLSRFSGSGQLPLFDFWTEYPPLLPWLASLAYRLSLLIPPWGDAMLWFNLIFRLLLLPFDLGTLTLIYASVCRLSTRERAFQVSGLWALLFAPFFTFLAWFEPLALFFLVLGLYGLLVDRPSLAGVAIGLGFMVKVLPIAILPLGLFTFRSNRQRIVYVGSATLTVALVILPPLISAPAYTAALFRVFLSRSSYETIWALLEGYTGYGVVAPLAARADPGAAGFLIHPSSLPWPLISLGFAILYVFLITRRIEWGDKRGVAQFALLSLALLVLYSRGYSPQWATYLGTLALLALPTGRGLGYALLLDILMIVEWPVAFVLLGGQDWFLAAVIILRTALTILLSLDCLTRVLPAAPAWHTIRRMAFPLALLVSVIAALVLVGPATHEYAAARLQAESLAPFIESFRSVDSPPDLVIVIQPELLERLRPYLPGKAVRLFPNAWGDPWEEVDAWLSATSASHSRAWLLYKTDETHASLYDDAGSWFDAHACLTSQVQYGAVAAKRYVLGAVLEEQPMDVSFENGLHLVAATPPPRPLLPGDAFCLRLTWLAQAPVPVDYAVLVHLVSGDEQLVAQGDKWPPIPTSMWAPGETVTSTHEVALSPDLPPGTYALWVGLYEIDGGTRARLADGSDAIWLADLVLARPTP